jgi:hypothetical protein
MGASFDLKFYLGWEKFGYQLNKCNKKKGDQSATGRQKTNHKSVRSTPRHPPGPSGQSFTEAAFGLALFALAAFTGLFIGLLAFKLFKQTVAGNFTLQGFDGLFHVVVADGHFNAHVVFAQAKSPACPAQN